MSANAACRPCRRNSRRSSKSIRRSVMPLPIGCRRELKTEINFRGLRKMGSSAARLPQRRQGSAGDRGGLTSESALTPGALELFVVRLFLFLNLFHEGFDVRFQRIDLHLQTGEDAIDAIVDFAVQVRDEPLAVFVVRMIGTDVVPDSQKI